MYDAISNTVANLPPHLGFGSQAATAVFRAALARRAGENADRRDRERAHGNQSGNQKITEYVKIFGHLCDVIHRHRASSQGRIWLLLRHMDQRGEGRIFYPEAVRRITSEIGDLRCISQKRLRQVLNQGEGVFWHRSRDRQWIYYHSEIRVARFLGLTRIKGWAVEIAIPDLLKAVPVVRSIFYDAFHSARGEGFNNPISRGIMHGRGGSERRTQRKYERIRGIQQRANYALIGRYKRSKWHQLKAAADNLEIAGEAVVGGPAFIYVDFKGVLGHNAARERRKPGQRHWHNIYMVQQIGNTYAGTLPTVKRGRRWTNLKLKNLCHSMCARPVTAEQSAGSILVNEVERQRQLKFYHEDKLTIHDDRIEPIYVEQPKVLSLFAGDRPQVSVDYWLEQKGWGG